jgi:phage baseplate assembly protein gpV
MNDNNSGELLKRTIKKVYETMRVAMPAVIESYDATKSLATVKITIPHVRDDEDVLDVPIISAVPVMWLSTLTTRITFPLQRGDWGLLIHCDGDIGKWAVDMDASQPQSKRRHAWTDAVFLPQMHGLQPSSLNGLELKYMTNTVTLSEAGITVASLLAVNVTAPTITLTGNTTITGNLNVSGTSTMAGIPFATHKHGGVTVGAGLTGNPQ